MRPFKSGPDYFELVIDLLDKMLIPVGSMIVIGLVWALAIFALMKVASSYRRPRKKMSIEINGIANMHMLLDAHKHYLEDNVLFAREDEGLHNKMKAQLEMTERYMLAMADSANTGRQLPAWHEILANPKNFKTMSERRSGS
jgi:hypothetical protein